MKTNFSFQTPHTLPSTDVSSNVRQGSYSPKFFNLSRFALSRIELDSCYYGTTDVEAEIIRGQFSFAYLREDKLRTIKAYDMEGKQIPFDAFLSHFRINIKSKNLFKTGKYLSRVFRPVRYGAFYNNLDVHINNNHNGKQTDGISLLSLRLAKSLGYDSVKPGMSVQITLFSNLGLLKGNAVISDVIGHDLIIYGEDNLKKELFLGEGLNYVSIEPLKLGQRLRLDVQTLVNLWNLFGGEQYLLWAYKGIESYKEDLLSGKLNEWLDNFDELDADDYKNELWTLRKAIWRGVDYRNFPGLMRLAYNNFRTSMKTYAENTKGAPIFRIPVPSGKRGYLRVDLRNHDADGNFISSVEQGKVVLDSFGNIWISVEDIEQYTGTLGGGDLDDNAGVIPLAGGNALLYRNPNAFGEFIVCKIEYDGIEIKDEHSIPGQIVLPVLKERKEKSVTQNVTENRLFNKFLAGLDKEYPAFLNYDRINLLRNYIKIAANQTNIGTVCNAEMFRSAIGIHSTSMQKKLIQSFNWNLERVIDSSTKEGVSCEEDLNNVSAMYRHFADNKIKLPKSLASRLPEQWRNELSFSDRHELDELLEALNLLIERTDLEVLGSGSANRGNRLPGLIDNCQVPLLELGKMALNNPIYDLSVSLLKDYNREIAILLENSKNDPNKDAVRAEGIKAIQSGLLIKMKDFTDDERTVIVNGWAYEIYKCSSFVHDSILWIGDQEDLHGTAEDMFRMLANTGEVAYQISVRPELIRTKEVRSASVNLKSLRVWSKDQLDPKDFADIRELVVSVKKVKLGNQELNLGDEYESVKDGIYAITAVAPSVSRKNNGRVLKNSLTIYLNA